MPFQSEKQKKWMWANKPEMAREWTQEYGSKVKAKRGIMAKTDDKWIQKATKNMRKDKPCTGDKFGGPTCPKGSRRYNLAKTFKKMNKPKKAFLGKMFRKSSTATPTSGGSSGGGSSGMGGLLRRLFEEKKHLFGKAGGGPIKAQDSRFINEPPKWTSGGGKRRTMGSHPKSSGPKKINKEWLEWKYKTKLAGGGPIKAQDSKFIRKKKWWANPKKLKSLTENLKADLQFINEAHAGKLSPSLMEKAKEKMQKPLVPKKYQKIIEDKIKWDEAKGGQSFTPGWKPHLSVKTAKRGKIFDSKKVSPKTHERFMKLFKHRERGGWKEAKGYKKHLKALKAMQTTPLSGTSTALPPKTARLLSNLQFVYKDKGKSKKFAKLAKDFTKTVGVFPYMKGKTKASTALGKASTSTFLKRRMALSGAGSLPGTLPRATALKVAKALGKRTGIGKAVLAATAVAGAYEAGKRKLFTKDKKKVQKKSTGGEIIIGRGVDLDLL